MKKIGLFYSANAVKTSQIAKKNPRDVRCGEYGYNSGRESVGKRLRSV